MSEREQTIAMFQQSLTAMEQVRAQEAAIEKIEKKLQGWKSVGRPKIGLGIVMYLIMFIAVLSVFNALTRNVYDKLPSGVRTFIWVICFIAPIVVFVLLNIKIKNIEKELAAAQIPLQKAKSVPELNWLPDAYSSSIAFDNMFTYLQNMRANNLQEAINLLETEIHRAIVEENTEIAAAYSVAAAANAQEAKNKANEAAWNSLFH